MHTIKLLLTYYLNISVQATNLPDCRIESNRKNRFGSENRIETFLPELECSNDDEPDRMMMIMLTMIQPITITLIQSSTIHIQPNSTDPLFGTALVTTSN